MNARRLLREGGDNLRFRYGLTLVVVNVMIVAGVSGLLVYLSPGPVPEIRFYVLSDTYRLGETVEFALENRHTLSFCHGGVNPWRVYRLVNDTWERVEVHDDVPAFYSVAPGNARQWSWRAENDPERAEFGLPEVAAGDYRVEVSGSLCLSTSDPDPTAVLVRAAFRLET